MAGTVPIVPAPESHRRRWIAGLILAFILGFLLAWFLKKCPQQSPGGGGGTGNSTVSRGGAPGGGGSPVKLGKGSGTPASGGGGGGGGNSEAGGGGGGAGGGDADVNLGTSPDGKPGPGTDPPGSLAHDTSLAGSLIPKMAGGDMPTGEGKGDTVPTQPPPGTVLSARDFSYDSTGLPRYSSGVQGIASGVATDTVHHKKSTMAAIVTNDSFDSVVTWYKSQVPAGWHAQSMGDMGAVAKAMSPQAILGMLSGAASGKPVDTTAISVAMKGNADNSVAIFNPPNQTADPRSIMIVKKKGKPTEIMMSKKLQQ